MTTRKAVIRGIIVLIVVFIICPLILNFIPIKSAIDVSSQKALKKLANKDEKLYICKNHTYTGPDWEIIGDENGLYSSEDKNEFVFIEGNSPYKEIDQKNFYQWGMFIFKGTVVGEKKDWGEDKKYKVIKIGEWYIASPVFRTDTSLVRDIISPSWCLNIYDYIWFKKWFKH